MAEDEKVLVFPAGLLDGLGRFQGVLPAGKASPYLEAVLDPSALFYMDRAEAEANEAYKQVIPYCLLRMNGLYLRYPRTKKGGEARLHEMWSIGVGGHVNPVDGEPGTASYVRALSREVREEVGYRPGPGEGRASLRALLNDDSDPVGRVHFGLVHVLDLPPGHRLVFKDRALGRATFASLRALQREKESFEGWSRLLIEGLLSGLVKT